MVVLDPRPMTFRPMLGPILTIFYRLMYSPIEAQADRLARPSYFPTKAFFHDPSMVFLSLT